jgi:hypothetical protein
MSAEDLVAAALNAGEQEPSALVTAIAVFAAAGGAFITANQELLRKTWHKVRGCCPHLLPSQPLCPNSLDCRCVSP